MSIDSSGHSLSAKRKLTSSMKNSLRRAAGLAKFSKLKSGMTTMSHGLQSLEARMQMRRHKIRDFTPNVQYEFERGHFLIKTARNGAELADCLRLRFEVFHREFLQKKRVVGVDLDKLDLLCDHLVIIDKRHSNRVIGTYRLNCSRFNSIFYSADEFDIQNILDLPGHKLELGRACIHKDYRNGVVITLLWRAIAEYLMKTESQYLFGCASVKTMDARESGMIWKYLNDKGHIDARYSSPPIGKFKFPRLEAALQDIESSGISLDEKAIEDSMPALFHSYLKMGAKVCGEPALDVDFKCIDFLTVLKMEDLAPMFSKKYKV